MADRNAALPRARRRTVRTRVSLRSRRITRVIVCVHDEELFALHGFIKKTQKTPDGNLKLARNRKRQLEKTR